MSRYWNIHLIYVCMEGLCSYFLSDTFNSYYDLEYNYLNVHIHFQGTGFAWFSLQTYKEYF